MNYPSSRELGQPVELVVIRGLPGSGKSTLAKQMKTHVHVENDMYFMLHDGSYRYEPERMMAAIQWYQKRAKNALLQGYSVVVANTFILLEHIRPYEDMACELGISIRVIEARGNFKNAHDVPAEVVEKMRSQWEPLKNQKQDSIAERA